MKRLKFPCTNATRTDFHDFIDIDFTSIILLELAPTRGYFRVLSMLSSLSSKFLLYLRNNHFNVCTWEKWKHSRDDDVKIMISHT